LVKNAHSGTPPSNATTAASDDLRDENHGTPKIKTKPINQDENYT
jgi:hypothetical protein